MRQQTSFVGEDTSGLLYLVPTPIGNLEDMTFRAIRILKEVDLIAAEDTRQSMKLCRHFEIETSLVSYHEHNKRKAGETLIEKLKEGKHIALVSDAGMPAISDPGQDLVKEAIEAGIKVISLPGANAALTSLVASGLSTDRFEFIGFLPRQNKQRQTFLEEIKNNQSTLIFYESPHRLKEALEAMYKVLGNRNMTISRELTKKFEEYQRGTLEDAIKWCETGTIKGEFCLVVEGNSLEEEKEEWWNLISVPQHVEHYIGLGMSSKDAIKQVARERNIQKRMVYAEFHQE
ncbi:16S rRNA (cytidine(1402)-2'-O)-methyltransferase [Halalkalibacter akibai]|uniref:Ribosomal RNA small subunit methyltransferase I n=1 Tax=Halalkalibacter akibai (strain ATCC 43226 / DSM 21942 / CIP 109018 / JCM 9157 / 1139) TaxID=1236973 RepID=W4QWQ0_HALA3|nr:16S rRNA (cytidine(1402)-2'-O)-methyltransferase [Halalkalibacter akibai]GAE36550.1 rRNA small subunit methyltransferase I [Halalkalibacter akibai JCM 9157]